MFQAIIIIKLLKTRSTLNHFKKLANLIKKKSKSFKLNELYKKSRNQLILSTIIHKIE